MTNDYKNGYNQAVENMLSMITDKMNSDINCYDSIGSIMSSLRIEILHTAFEKLKA